MTDLSFVIPCLRRASKVTGVGYAKPEEVVEFDYAKYEAEYMTPMPPMPRPLMIRQTNEPTWEKVWKTQPMVFDDVEYWNEVMKIPVNKRIAAYKVSMLVSSMFHDPVQYAFSVLKG
jgi:hypothetical protein